MSCCSPGEGSEAGKHSKQGRARAASAPAQNPRHAWERQQGSNISAKACADGTDLSQTGNSWSSGSGPVVQPGQAQQWAPGRSRTAQQGQTQAWQWVPGCSVGTWAELCFTQYSNLGMRQSWKKFRKKRRSI